MSDNISRRAVMDAVNGLEYIQDYVKDYVNSAIGKVPSKDEWIPCSERLPEEYDEYLCQDADGYRFVGWLENAEWCKKHVVKWDIVAWMPLPEPYRKEKQ